MPYRSCEIDAPDPGSVDTSCPSCPAEDGEPCLPECACAECLRTRALTSQSRAAAKLGRHVARRTA